MPHRTAALPFTVQAVAGGVLLDAALPRGAAGEWCLVRMSGAAGAPWWAKLELTDTARGHIVREFFLGPARRKHGLAWRETCVHVPADAAGMRLRMFGDAASALHPHPDFHLYVVTLSRRAAAVRLLWFGRGALLGAIAGTPMGWPGRARALLGQAPARAGEAPPYAAWRRWFAENPPPAPEFPVQVVVIADGLADSQALRATRDSIFAQLPAPSWPLLIVRHSADWRDVRAPWVVILQSGELLEAGALAWFGHAAHAFPDGASLVGDCDALGDDGERTCPLFNPAPDRLYLESGLATRGACAFRWPADLPELPVDAAKARLALALRVAERTVHVARILSHIPRCAMAQPPLWVRHVRADGYAPRVTALIPTAARTRHVVTCVRRILATNSYNNLTVSLIVAAPHRASPRILGRLAALPGLTVRRLSIEPFNYAKANNEAAQSAAGELFLLVNDDVAPLAPGWLDSMVAHFQDATVGAVGARLLYGNGMVQHEGVILGLANLCEHAGRLRAGSEAGPHDIGRVARQVSAVTAACLLIRADLYRAIGGMDEAFAIALNDVDLCLRVTQAGYRVVYCPQAVLYHFESLSLGRHYAGIRAGLESLEVGRLRARWRTVIDADPFYNPQASLEPGREWQPAFPPRNPGKGRMATNPLADH